MKDVLILIPTNKDKGYTIGSFISNLKSIDLSRADVLFSEDGVTDDYKKTVESIGFEVVKVDKTVDSLKKGEKLNIVQCLANTRNTLRREFINRKQYKHAIWFDSDIIMPKNTISLFLDNKDKDIVTGLYWQWRTRIENRETKRYLYPVVFKYQENECSDIGIHTFGAELNINEIFPNRLIGGEKDPIRIIALGTGCFMMSRRLMEDENWSFRFNPDKPETTEDMWFSIDIRELGYEIYLDSRICCRHNMKTWQTKIKTLENQK